MFSFDQNAFVLSAEGSSSSSYPLLKLVHFWDDSPSTGSYSATSSVSTSSVSLGNTYVWYWESDDDCVSLTYSDGNTENAGDCWDKSIYLNITALDLNSMTISFTASATMGHVMDVLDGSTWSAASSRNLTITATNISMDYNSKGVKNAPRPHRDKRKLRVSR